MAVIGVDALLELILGEVSPLPAAEASTLGAVGRVLAEDVLAVDSSPPFANSAMDGYAVRWDDLPFEGESSHRLRLVDDLPAGATAARPIRPGEAAVIATGGMLPPGAEVVVPIEQTSRDGDDVTVYGSVPAHGHVRPVGDDVRAGSVVGRSGELVTDRLAAIVAAVGVPSVMVVPRPRVGVLTTGDELLPLGAPLVAGKIRDVNGLLLRSALEAIGVEAVDLGTVTDDATLIAGRLTTAPGCDAIVVSGGLGKARRDIVVETIGKTGTVHAVQVAMRPGKPFAFGHVGGPPVYAVPGNPVAAIVALHVLVAPALRRLAGRRPAAHSAALLTEDASGGAGRRHYLRVRLAWMDGSLVATPVGHGGSGSVSSLAAADGLLVIPETVDTARAGETFGVIPFAPREGW